MGGYSNKFDKPLQSELEEHQQQQAATLKASPVNNPFDEPLASEKAEANLTSQGEQSNDVGNTVIVPREGESFADTMKRAATYGKTVTPQQVQSELKTAPAKAVTVLAAAPAIGAAGTAALAAPGELAGAAERFLQISEKALEHLGENYPQLTKLAAKLGYGAGAAGAYKLLNKLGLH